MDDRKRIKDERLGGGLGDGNGLSWLFGYAGVMAKLEPVVSAEEKVVLRELAKKVAVLAEDPIQEERRKLWDDHLCLKETRPLVFIDPELAWYEILPHTMLRCKNAVARVWEFRLLKEIFWQEHIKDDRVCRKEFSIQHVLHVSDFGIKVNNPGGEHGGAYHVAGVINDYDTDMGKLHFREVWVDWDKSNKMMDLAHDVFDGILEVKWENSWWYSCGLTCDAINLRGFENFLYDMYDYPDELKALMAFLRDDWLHYLDFLEKNGLLTLNNGGEFMATGGYGWCSDLPAPDFDPAHVRPIDMWGYGESQETVSVSPDAFAEFVLPYQLPILERFGLNSYGCCEPLDNRIDILMKEVPRLRKVTVSPWANVRTMAEKLGKDYVYCWKMNPSLIATEKCDWDLIRNQLRETFTVTHEHGCPTEVLMRDILTLAWKPENASKWTEIAMEEANRCMEYGA